jgi:hypothetical protein
MSVIPVSPLRLTALRAVERKEIDRFEGTWYDRLNHQIIGHAARALRELLHNELIALEDQNPGREWFLAVLTEKGRRVLADWESPAPVVYRTRPRLTALQAAAAETLHYDGGFTHASGEQVREYLATPLRALLRAGLLSVREVPGAVTVTEAGLVHLDRWVSA